MTTDPHELVAELAASLRAEGFPDWAGAIEDAVAGGATGTEILMALRWTAKKLLRARLPLSVATRAQAKTLTAAVDIVLGR